MGSSAAEMYATMFEESAAATIKAAEKVPESKRMFQTQPGKAHPLWLVGHLANTASLLINRWCCEAENLMPKEYTKRFSPDFAQGDPITNNAADYPSWEETLSLYKKITASCVENIRKLDDATLNGELRGGAPDAMKQVFGNVGKTLRSMALHDSYHRGQLNLLLALK